MSDQARLSLQLVCTLLALAILGATLDWPKFFAQLSQGKWHLLAPAWGLFAVLLVLQALRFHLLVHQATMRFSKSLGLVLTAFFFNNLMPGGTAGDFYKVIALKRSDKSFGFAISRTILDRLAGLLPVSLAMIFAIVMSKEIRNLLWEGVQLGFLFPIAGILLLGSWLILRKSRLGAQISEIVRQSLLETTSLDGLTWIGLLMLSSAGLMARCGRFYICLQIFEADLLLVELLLFLGVLSGVSLLPLSLGGIGIHESAIAGCLALFGVSLSVGTAVALVNRALILSLAAVGAIVYLLSRTPRQASEPKPTAPPGR